MELRSGRRRDFWTAGCSRSGGALGNEECVQVVDLAGIAVGLPGAGQQLAVKCAGLVSQLRGEGALLKEAGEAEPVGLVASMPMRTRLGRCCLAKLAGSRPKASLAGWSLETMTWRERASILVWLMSGSRKRGGLDRAVKGRHWAMVEGPDVRAPLRYWQVGVNRAHTAADQPRA